MAGTLARLFNWLDINSATLSGAVDIIVVRQEDGTLKSTPFHVRFGKLHLLRSKEKKVSIAVNGEAVDLQMEIGSAGEAAFVTETTEDDGELEDRFMSPVESPVSTPIQPSKEVMEEMAELNLVSVDEYNANAGLSAADQAGLGELTAEETAALEAAEHAAELEASGAEHPAVLEGGRGKEVGGHAHNGDWVWKWGHLPKADGRTLELDIPDGVTDVSTETPMSPRDLDSRTDSPNHSELARSSSPTGEGLESKESQVQSPSKRGILGSFMSIFRSPSLPPSDSPDIDDDDDADLELGEAANAGPGHRNLDDTLATMDDSAVHSRKDSTPTTHRHSSDSVLANPSVRSGKGMQDSGPRSSSRDAADGQNSQEGPDAAEFMTPLAIPSQGMPLTEDGTQVLASPVMPQNDASMSAAGASLFPQRASADGADSSSPSGSEQPLVDSIMSISPEMALHRQESALLDGGDNSDAGSPRGITLASMLETGYLELSLCGNEPEFSSGQDVDDDAKLIVFQRHRVTYEALCSNPGLISDPQTLYRLGRLDRYVPWNVASPVIVSLLGFRKMLPDDVIESLLEASAKKESDQSTSGWKWGWWRRGNNNAKDSNAKDVSTPTSAVPQAGSVQHPSQGKDGDAVQQPVPSEASGPPPTQSTRFLKRSLKPSAEQLESLPLKDGRNDITFSVTSKLQGTQTVEARIWLWPGQCKLVVSDIDGTITKSDVLGQLLPRIGKDWSHQGVCSFFTHIKDNGYRIMYLSSRAIGQSNQTRDYLYKLKQGSKDVPLPEGPVILSPDRLLKSFSREVIQRRPEEFKIHALQSIASVFHRNPFYAGFGNRETDYISYRAVGIPQGKIFVINVSGQVRQTHMTHVFSTSYPGMDAYVDAAFPPLSGKSKPHHIQEDYNHWNYWRVPLPQVQVEEDLGENELTVTRI